jgi:sugar lactone lactonase YvrE
MKVRWLALLLVLLLSIPFTAAAATDTTDPIDLSQAGDAGGPAAPPHVLVRGAPIHGANGIAFGKDDRLYIASVWGSEIVVMEPDSGRILARLGLPQGVESPDDLTFGPDGGLYFTSILTGKVQKIAPDGNLSTVAQLPPGANPITFSDTGRLFVGLAFLGDALYEVDPTGAAAPRLIASNLGGINAFDWGADGYLYAPIMNKGEVVKIDVDTGSITPVATGFGFPGAAKFGAAGTLFVLDQATGQVLELDLETGARQLVAQLVPGLDNLAWDAKGRLFVSHAEDGSITRVLPNGKGVYISRPGIIAPAGVAVMAGADGRENLFVADLWTVRRFDAQAGTPRPLGDYTRAFPAFTVAPFGDKLVLTSIAANAVVIMDPVTHAVLWGDASFAMPVNAIAFQGDVVVCEAMTGQVVRQTLGGGRTTLAQLYVPSGLAAKGDDLWVADRAAGAVFQVVAGGEVLAQPRPVAGGLAKPEGLAVDEDGGFYVVETGARRLSYIDPATGQVTPIASGLVLSGDLPGMPPTGIFNGVAVAPSGAVFVTADRASRVYRLDLK